MSHENQRLEDGFPIEIIHWNYDQDAIVTTRIIPFVLGNPEKNLYDPSTFASPRRIVKSVFQSLGGRRCCGTAKT